MNDNRIYWVRGNTQELLIPLEQEIVPQEGEVEVVPYYPDAEATVQVRLVGKYRKLSYTPTVDGNLLRLTENATLPSGVYGVEVVVENPDGTRYRSLWDNQIVVTDQNDSVLQEWDEFRQLDVSARAAVFFFAKGDKGDAFTYDDFTPEQIAELQKPASDAAEELTQEVHALEQQFTEQENHRIANENQREENEASRVQAENARHQQFSADHQRAVSDHTQYGSDHANELQRQQNEMERQQSESGRVTKESERESAEQIRKAAETIREQQAQSDHAQYSTNHQTAQDDHTTAAADHTQASNDHTASVDATVKASNVNATISGMIVTITDKNGVSTSVNIGFDITKTYASVSAMNADAANVEEGTFVMIATTDTTSTENARLYVRNSNAASSETPFTFLCDLDQAATSAWADWFNNYKPTIESDHTRAENDHVTAATDHAQAENDHATAQSDHTQYTQDHEKEIERESAETLRKQSETQRQANETVRQQAEAQRAANETVRQQAEAQRAETFAGYETFMHGYDDRLSALEITQEQFNGIFND